MVRNFLKKRKKEETKKEETFAGGRIVLTDFNRLDKENYPQYADMIFLNYDGRIYIDSTEPANGAIITIMRMLVQHPIAELRQFERQQRKKYPDIRDATDLQRLQGKDEDFLNALAMLLIPAEIRSRTTQREYYGIV